MKNNFITLLLIFGFQFLLFSCKPNNVPDEPVKPIIIDTVFCSVDSITTNLRGGKQTVNIYSNGTWGAKVFCDWVSLNKYSGEGNDNVVLELEAGGESSSLIVFTCGTCKDTIFVERIASLFNIVVTSNDTLMGVVIGGGEYKEGTTINIEARPNEGFEFVSWNTGDNSNPKTITVSEDAVYEASFKPIKFYDGSTGGKFLVSDDKWVKFSRGNLQYNQHTKIWRFSENQCKGGDANKHPEEDYDGWFDLFYWSCTSKPYGVYDSCLRTEYTGEFVDWGNNEISNSVNMSWRTLTQKEMEYLLFSRPFAEKKKSVCKIAGNSGGLGLMLIPDDYNWYFYEPSSSKTDPTYVSWTQWQELEEHGAVFLPYLGQRTGSWVEDVGYPYYWTSTPAPSTEQGYQNAYCLFCFQYFYVGAQAISVGQSVRLVSDVVE